MSAEGPTPVIPGQSSTPSSWARLRPELSRRLPRRGLALSFASYIQVIKPRETSLLAFVGVCGAIVAAAGFPPLDKLLIALGAVTLGSAGANGLTNYLDRDLDARLRRTQGRPLPSGRIAPPQKVIPWAGGLAAVGLALAWVLHPYAFWAGAVGVATSWIGRRYSLTHLWGGIFGSAPLLVGWLGLYPELNATILLMCLLIVCWVPVHVWSVMVTHWDDYLQAGVRMFPLRWSRQGTLWLMLAAAVLSYLVSLAIYLVGGFGLVYLTAANLTGLLIVVASFWLISTGASQAAFRLYRISAYPYLGLLFLGLCLDLWLRGLGVG